MSDKIELRIIRCAVLLWALIPLTAWILGTIFIEEPCPIWAQAFFIGMSSATCTAAGLVWRHIR